jgi:glycosyltransferase involved in cell wall biosynthesis
MTARVVLLSTNLARGGAETQVAALAVELRRRGWEVTVISMLEPSALADELEGAGVPLRSLGMRPGTASPLGVAKLVKLLREFAPHILHAHLFHANLLARLVRLVCPAPVVISTIHSLAESGRESHHMARRDLAYRLTDRLSDATVCVSHAAAERHVSACAISARGLRVIPNGVDTSRFRPDEERRDRTRRELGLGDEFTWLAVGRLMWKKDYPTMLRAMARHGAGVLLVAGAGPLEEDLRALAVETGARVRFLGAREDVPDLMRAADAFVLSSVVEGLPLVLLEAAASGLPAAATDVGGVREAVLDGSTGAIAPPGDPVALADAMERVRTACLSMRAAARDHAVQHFDMHTVVDQWERLYAELLEAARRRDGCAT